MGGRSVAGEVLAIGDELLQGWAADSNSGEIAAELLAAGVRVQRFTAVGDDRAAIAAALREASARADVLITTGGLGPTGDDLTREGAADALGVALETVPELWTEIEERLKRRGPVPESNRRQAQRPVGAASIRNPVGSAPGFSFRLGKCRVFALPGVPREMRVMLAESVLPALAAEVPGALRLQRRTIRCFGASEAHVGERIARWMQARDANPVVGITVHFGVHTITVLARGDDAAAAGRLADETAGAIAAELGDLVFARDASSLEDVLARALESRRRTISFAESCTAGLAAALLANVPGVSAALRESFVVYTEDAKAERLGVSRETLRVHGSVSSETAAEMAAGVARATGADVGVSITGNAGPEPSEGKPVGLVWFGVAYDGRTHTVQRQYARFDRRLLREVAAREALNLARRALEGSLPRPPA